MAEGQNGDYKHAAHLVPRTQGPPPSAPGLGARVGSQTNAPSRNILAVAWQRRWIILLCIVVGLGAGVVYLSQAKSIYRSGSKVYVQQTGPRILNERGGMRAGHMAAQVEIIRSTKILSDAAELIQKQTEFLRGVSNPVGQLKQALGVSVGEQGQILTVSIASPDPQAAAAITNKVVEAYINHQSQQHRNSAIEVLKILQQEKQRGEEELRDLQARMLDIRREAEVLSFDGTGPVNPQLARLQSKLSTARLQTIDAKVAVDTAKEIDDPEQLRQLVQEQVHTQVASKESQAKSNLELQLEDLKIRLANLKSQFGDQHRAVKALSQQIASYERYLHGQQANAQSKEAANQARIADYRAILTRQWKKASEREGELRKVVESEKNKTLAKSATTVEYRQLRSSAERTKSLLNTLASRMKELNLTEDTGALNISILEPARVPGTPVKPKKARILAMALILGLMVGAAGAFLQELLDQRLRSSEEMAALLGVPVLGVVPHMKGSKKDRSRGLQTREHPQSNIAEAYRTIRTAIHFGGKANGDQTLLVTSPAAQEGKTTVACNLAIAFAQTGHKTLLIDADCRRPWVAKTFGVNTKEGLSSVLTGDCDLDAALVQVEPAPLHILPCGPVPSNPAELLNGHAYEQMLDELRQRFDRIIIDSPPVSRVTDARILAVSADKTLLVLRAERSSSKLAQHAREALLSVGGQLEGLIVNDVPKRRGGYGYGYYYGYSHVYGQEHKPKRLRGARETGGEQSKEPSRELT